ncbi:MAG: YheV family putative metal-binding protein [Pseudomonadales bacterium]
MRRFIAGAICPNCRAQDRIVVEQGAAGAQRRCVSCGYVDTLVTAPSAPTSRLERPRAGAETEQKPVPVRLLDPSKPER